MSMVEYSVPINIVHDNAETIATKKQFAKRQAFALLNTEMQDNAIYVIHTEILYAPSRPPFVEEDAPFVPGAGVLIYRIKFIAWLGGNVE